MFPLLIHKHMGETWGSAPSAQKHHRDESSGSGSPFQNKGDSGSSRGSGVCLKQRVTPFLSFDSYHRGAIEHGFQPQLVLVKLLISRHQYYTMAVTRFLIRVTDGRNQQMSTSVTVGLYKRAILETASLLSLSKISCGVAQGGLRENFQACN